MLTSLAYIWFDLIIVSSQNLQNQCPHAPQRFHINPDSSGAERCSLWPPPVKILPRTEHHGECLEACALTPECSSYNYFYDTTRCELICHPVHFGVVPNCINYLVSSSLILLILVCISCIRNVIPTPGKLEDSLIPSRINSPVVYTRLL